MKVVTITRLATILLISVATCSFAQSTGSHAEMHKPVVKNSIKRVLDKSLTDTGLVNKKFRAFEWTLAPGNTDTVSHRHAAEVFIYVIEGSIEYRLEKNEPIVYKKGQVLHEPPYSLHTLTRNPSTTESAKVLLMFLYTDGKDAPKYIREYPEKK